MAENNNTDTALAFPDLKGGDATTNTTTTDASAPASTDAKTDAPADTTTTPEGEGVAATAPLTIDPAATYLGPDGNPITGADLVKGVMLHADYSRKTQELAQLKEEALQVSAEQQNALKIGLDIVEAMEDADLLEEAITLLQEKHASMSGALYETDGEKALHRQLLAERQRSRALEERVNGIAQAPEADKTAALHKELVGKAELIGHKVTEDDVAKSLAMFPALAEKDPMLALIKAVEARKASAKDPATIKVPTGTSAGIDPKDMDNTALWEHYREKKVS